MGLDTVELVVRFENAFGINIPDDVAAQLTTPGQVVDYVMMQVALGSQPACLSQQAFYFLRGKFVPRLNIARNAFRPAYPLDNLIPRESRKLIWAGIKSEVGDGALPDLARPLWLFSLLAFFTTCTFVYAIYYAQGKIEGSLSVLFGLLVAMSAGYVGAILTRPLKQSFRRRHRSAGDLAKYLVLNSPNTFKQQNRSWTREQIASVVREIIIDETAIEDFNEDSHFIRDLHLD